MTVYTADWSSSSSASSRGRQHVFLRGCSLTPTTGLYYDSARWYNSSTGGFISRDPAGSEANLYSYVGDDPTGYTDPSGMYAVNPPPVSSASWIC